MQILYENMMEVSQYFRHEFLLGPKLEFKEKRRIKMKDRSSKFSIENLEIEGLKIITTFYAADERGYFLKDFEKNEYKSLGLENSLSESMFTNSKRGVIRGMHFQISCPQTKLVSVIKGEVLDVAVDLRKGSATFGKWKAVTLSDDNRKTFYIPAGFAHGYQVLSESALVSYKCIGDYDAETDSGIAYDDNELNISWVKGIEVITSQRDKNLMTFDTFINTYGGL